MSTVWIFGDSFADVGFCANNDSNMYTWMQEVPYQLNYTARFLAKGGTSLEYTYEQFNLVRSQIQPCDVIIIALTCPNRRWHIRDNITDNVWQLMQQSTRLKAALEAYLAHLNVNYEVYLENFLYNLESVKVRTIILPCFQTARDLLKSYRGSAYVADLCLYDISNEEFRHNLASEYHKKMAGVDLRACHLTATNHRILANKIVDYVNRGTVITNNGFRKDFINFDLLKTREFSQGELFNVHLVNGYDLHVKKL